MIKCLKVLTVMQLIKFVPDVYKNDFFFHFSIDFVDLDLNNISKLFIFNITLINSSQI